MASEVELLAPVSPEAPELVSDQSRIWPPNRGAIEHCIGWPAVAGGWPTTTARRELSSEG